MATIVQRRFQKQPPIPTPNLDPLADRQKEIPTTKTLLASKMTTASRTKQIPKVQDVKLEDSDEEDVLTLESIIKEKPSPKKVALFIQECINELMRESDDSETDMNDSEY